MLFFKPKLKDDGLLPPPPPLPDIELEEPEKKHKFFDEIAQPEEIGDFPEEYEFSNLVEDLEKSSKAEPIAKKGKTILKKAQKTKKQKSSKKLDRAKKIKLPKIELPETLEELDIQDLDKESEMGFEAKPQEIVEAEEEIKSAIDNIKYQERPSLFKRLFTKKKAEEKIGENYIIPELPEINKVSAIQNNIKKAREALMEFDLKTAKQTYLEIMEIYNNIGPEEQVKVYHDIKELYSERKSAEGLKV